MMWRKVLDRLIHEAGWLRCDSIGIRTYNGDCVINPEGNKIFSRKEIRTHRPATELFSSYFHRDMELPKITDLVWSDVEIDKEKKLLILKNIIAIDIS